MCSGIIDFIVDSDIDDVTLLLIYLFFELLDGWSLLKNQLKLC